LHQLNTEPINLQEESKTNNPHQSNKNQDDQHQHILVNDTTELDGKIIQKHKLNMNANYVKHLKNKTSYSSGDNSPDHTKSDNYSLLKILTPQISSSQKKIIKASVRPTKTEYNVDNQTNTGLVTTVRNLMETFTVQMEISSPSSHLDSIEHFAYEDSITGIRDNFVTVNTTEQNSDNTVNPTEKYNDNTKNVTEQGSDAIFSTTEQNSYDTVNNTEQDSDVIANTNKQNRDNTVNNNEQNSYFTVNNTEKEMKDNMNTSKQERDVTNNNSDVIVNTTEQNREDTVNNTDFTVLNFTDHIKQEKSRNVLAANERMLTAEDLNTTPTISDVLVLEVGVYKYLSTLGNFETTATPVYTVESFTKDLVDDDKDKTYNYEDNLTTEEVEIEILHNISTSFVIVLEATEASTDNPH